MLKSFKLFITVVMVTASSIGAVAQTVTYKDVRLDGKPAKLNMVTGEVTLVDANKTSLNTTKKAETATKPVNAEINDDIISDKPKAKTSEKPTVKVVENTTDGIPKPRESKMSKEAEKATTLVYDTSQPIVEDLNDSDYHLVKKGETLYSLSKRYTVTLADLKRANNLETTLIKSGQKLRVKNIDALDTLDFWTVSKGDTLYNISKRTNTTVDAIKGLNGLQSNLIKIGQVLRIK